MSFMKFWFCGVLCVLILKTAASNESDDVNKIISSFEDNNEISSKGAGKNSLNVNKNFIDEVAEMLKWIRAEFAQQREELQRQKVGLTTIMRGELAEYKTAQEKFMKNEFQSLIERGNNEPETVHSRKWDKNFNCTENCDANMDLPSSCEEAMATATTKDGVYLLKIQNSKLKPFYAYCQRIDNKIWTVMQRREDGSVSFYRNWQDYKYGFGNLYGEFWLGLERLSVLTNNHEHELHIWMETQGGTTGYAHYAHFSIGNETDKYRLSVSGYSGNAEDSLIEEHDGMQFSTYDNNNDKTEAHYCPTHFKGAWWFNACYSSHLNGLYHSAREENIHWIEFDYNLKSARMAIRQISR